MAEREATGQTEDANMPERDREEDRGRTGKGAEDSGRSVEEDIKE